MFLMVLVCGIVQARSSVPLCKCEEQQDSVLLEGEGPSPSDTCSRMLCPTDRAKAGSGRCRLGATDMRIYAARMWHVCEL